MVRSADTLASAGYIVRVVAGRYDKRWSEMEPQFFRDLKWNFEAVEYLSDFGSRFRWHIARFKRRIAEKLSCTGIPWAHQNMLAYGPKALELRIRASHADLVIGHTHAAFPIAYRAAHKLNAKVAFDLEDLLTERPNIEQSSNSWIEKRFVHRGNFLMTMSETASDYFSEKYRLTNRPIALLNAARITERGQIVPPAMRSNKEMPTVYWYGQTIGSHTCADQVIRSMQLCRIPFRFIARGNSNPQYINEMVKLSENLGVANRVEFLPAAPPAELTRLASEHDVIWGAQPGDSLYNQCAIGNKVMSALSAGLAALVTETRAHKQLFNQFGGWGEMVPDNSPSAIARVLERWFENPKRLLQLKERAWSLGSGPLSWESESKKLLDCVESVFS